MLTAKKMNRVQITFGHYHFYVKFNTDHIYPPSVYEQLIKNETVRKHENYDSFVERHRTPEDYHEKWVCPACCDLNCQDHIYRSDIWPPLYLSQVGLGKVAWLDLDNKRSYVYTSWDRCDTDELAAITTSTSYCPTNIEAIEAACQEANLDCPEMKVKRSPRDEICDQCGIGWDSCVHCYELCVRCLHENGSHPLICTTFDDYPVCIPCCLMGEHDDDDEGLYGKDYCVRDSVYRTGKFAQTITAYAEWEASEGAKNNPQCYPITPCTDQENLRTLVEIYLLAVSKIKTEKENARLKEQLAMITSVLTAQQKKMIEGEKYHLPV